ncbi:MAG: ferritin-like domain-containing protein [Chitinophagaceae bacterium]|nr:ferritin-like domain-containing protein [Chitinophagaceae bacterium]
MEQMNDLKELLRHDVQHLYSAEEQIITALPLMIARAHSPELKQALEQHLKITEKQRERLDDVRRHLGVSEDSVKKYTGFLANLLNGGVKSRSMQGIIEEGQKVMAENLSPEVMDAAIIAGNQKIEHNEIACYGTVRTWAEQLGLTEVAQLLQQTLDEEYEADKILSGLAVANINPRAESNVNSNLSGHSGSVQESTNGVTKNDGGLLAGTVGIMAGAGVAMPNETTNTSGTGSFLLQDDMAGSAGAGSGLEDDLKGTSYLTSGSTMSDAMTYLSDTGRTISNHFDQAADSSTTMADALGSARDTESSFTEDDNVADNTRASALLSDDMADSDTLRDESDFVQAGTTHNPGGYQSDLIRSEAAMRSTVSHIQGNKGDLETFEDASDDQNKNDNTDRQEIGNTLHGQNA